MKKGLHTAIVVLGSALALASAPGRAAAVAPLPQRLSETGLYAEGSTTVVRQGVLQFSPQYPLWSDGAAKRRWISLPPGTSIDASNPDAWEFPVGTRLWKEFSLGRKIETRLIERVADGSWRFAAYVWNEAGTEATLAPADGFPRLQLTAASRDGTYAVPGEYDCRACHEGAPVPVLGFSALQLSSDRDPLAPHAEKAVNLVDLRQLVARGWLRNLPQPLLDSPPRIAASSPVERAALGYLHGNCGHCHAAPGDSDAAVPVNVVLAQRVTGTSKVRRDLVGMTTRFRPAGAQQAHPAQVVVPGQAKDSVLALRMSSRDPRVQMPPLGTAFPDTEALALVERWINQDLNQQQMAQELSR